MVAATLVSLRIAPPKAAKGPLVGPLPFRFRGPLPKVQVPEEIRSSCAPAVIVSVKVDRSLLKRIEPTVWAASRVTVRLAVWAGLEPVAAPLKVALAPTELGTAAGFQFAAAFQLPPTARFQVCALAEEILH